MSYAYVVLYFTGCSTCVYLKLYQWSFPIIMPSEELLVHWCFSWSQNRVDFIYFQHSKLRSHIFKTDGKKSFYFLCLTESSPCTEQRKTTKCLRRTPERFRSRWPRWTPLQPLCSVLPSLSPVLYLCHFLNKIFIQNAHPPSVTEESNRQCCGSFWCRGPDLTFHFDAKSDPDRTQSCWEVWIFLKLAAAPV